MAAAQSRGRLGARLSTRPSPTEHDPTVQAPDARPGTPWRLAEAARSPVAAALDRLGSDEAGLSAAEAGTRLAAVGANVIHQRRTTALDILVRQLRNPLLLLLLSAAVVSTLTGDPKDAAIIAAIVALSVGLGFFNEYRSPRPWPPCTRTSATRRWPGATGPACASTWPPSFRAMSSGSGWATWCPPICG